MRSRYACTYVFDPAVTRTALIRKNRPAQMAGTWCPLGGHVEPGESPAQAAVREVLEEGGVALSRVQLIGMDVSPITRGIISFFVAQVAMLHWFKTQEDEEVRVFGLGDLPQKMSPLVPEYLELALRRARSDCGCGGMEDTPVLETGAVRRGGSSPSIRTK